MPSRRPFQTEMLCRVRTLHAVRLALCLAAAIAVCASFGLHPEPAGFASAPQSTALAKSGAPEATHGCVACLTHGVAVASPLVGIVLAGFPCETNSLIVDPLLHGRLAGGDLPGRSPPLDPS